MWQVIRRRIFYLRLARREEGQVRIRRGTRKRRTGGRARSNHHHHRSPSSSYSSYRPQSRFRISYLSAAAALAYTGQGREEGGRVTLICNGVRRARGQRTRDRKKESTGGFFFVCRFHFTEEDTGIGLLHVFIFRHSSHGSIMGGCRK